jgi:uncharacterized protein YfiM (DUF2279 family)
MPSGLSTSLRVMRVPSPLLVCLILIGILIGLPQVARAEDRWLARDKAEHAAASAGIAAAGYGLAATATDRPKWRVVVGLSAGIGAGTAKELWDRSHGEASWRDLSWDAIGSAAGVAIAWAVDRAVGHRRQAQPGSTSAWRTRELSTERIAPRADNAFVVRAAAADGDVACDPEHLSEPLVLAAGETRR